MTRPIIKGLYAITPDWEDTTLLIDKVVEVLEAGASVLQYRNKTADKQLRLDQASAIKKICQRYAVPFIINDDFELCKHLDTDGVHLGKDDHKLTEVRNILGKRKIIGVSCYNDVKRAKDMLEEPCDYIALGACFASQTKPKAPLANPDFISKVVNFSSKPVVAIGGITLDNCKVVLNCGVNAIAMVNEIFASQNAHEAVTNINKVISRYE